VRVISELSIGIEIDIINAGLPIGAWLCVPCAHPQLDLAEFLHRETTPEACAFWGQRLGTVATSFELIAKDVPLA
jgi:hypothetical protein